MRVFGLGETVYDIIFKNGTPVAAKPGGSVLNAMVSLARVGVECYFISELGQDNVAEIIISFLKENKVSTQFVQQYTNGQSALAMAFLNAENDANYEFYKNYPNDRLTQNEPDFKSDDILLFGSSYAIDKNIRTRVTNIVSKAKAAGATIIYDPNFRNKDGVDNRERIELVKQNIAFADVVRGSNEDFEQLFSLKNASSVYKQIANSQQILVYTKNANGVELITPSLKLETSVDKIDPISTIGAGDNFNAGIIYSLVNMGVLKDDILKLNSEQLNLVLDNAKQFSKAVCMSMDNYVPKGFSLE